MKYTKFIFIVTVLILLVIVFAQCLYDNALAGNDERGNTYAGAETCKNCHKNIFDAYSKNVHYNTSSAINKDSLAKFIAASDNRFYFTDSSYVLPEQKNNGFFQSCYVNQQKTVEAKFDIAFGSGEKAQTYGYWKEDNLLQLPLTYFTQSHRWGNSPGFTAAHANFNRGIQSRCFECHASYVNKEYTQSGTLAVNEKLDRTSIIYGIDCERCHGPAAKHVQFQQENPAVKKAMFITSIRSLSRQQQLDACGVCHSGNNRSPRSSLFAFAPGDTLSNFYFPDFESRKAEPDVHGKQLQLLQLSKCYQQSNLTCGSCHNAHVPEPNPATLVTKCMQCHQNSMHAVKLMEANNTIKEAGVLSTNCIDCHMPLQSSKDIYSNGGTVQKDINYFLRTHRIAIYK
jgi:nitrate/TMAO reductase-like tetraheme cytochrome c subunit